MNKNTLYTGIIYTAIGLVLFTIALLGEYPYEAFLWGLGGGSIGTGISLLWRYFYWKRPSKEEDYQNGWRFKALLPMMSATLCCATSRAASPIR